MTSVESKTNQLNYFQRFMAEITRRSDKLIEIFLFGYFLFGLVAAFAYDTWLIALSVGGTLMLIYFLSKKLFPGRSVNQYVASGIVGVFMGQFIYQMHGMFEMHFFAFIGATLMITYQNWKVQIPLAAAIVLHHAIFGYFQYISFTNDLGNSIYFTQLNYMDLQTFIIHCFLAVVILAICCLWAHDMRRRTWENAKNIQAVEDLSTNFSKNIEFANLLANGEYNLEVDVDRNDPMASALLDLKEKLSKAAV